MNFKIGDRYENVAEEALGSFCDELSRIPECSQIRTPDFRAMFRNFHFLVEVKSVGERPDLSFSGEDWYGYCEVREGIDGPDLRLIRALRNAVSQLTQFEREEARIRCALLFNRDEFSSVSTVGHILHNSPPQIMRKAHEAFTAELVKIDFMIWIDRKMHETRMAYFTDRISYEPLREFHQEFKEAIRGL